MVDIAAFLDSAILIDVLRQYSPALNWLTEQRPGQFGITPIVWLEVVYGAPNKVKQTQAEKLLAQFTRLYPIDADLDWAMRQLATYRLSHNVGVLDCLIAAPAHRLQIPLYTTNTKHFTPLLDNLSVRPY